MSEYHSLKLELHWFYVLSQVSNRNIETRFTKDLRNQNCDIMNNVNIDNSESSEDGQSLQNGTKSRRYFFSLFVFWNELVKMFNLEIVIDEVGNGIVFDWWFENKRQDIFCKFYLNYYSIYCLVCRGV